MAYTIIMNRRVIHPFIAAMQQRNALMSTLLLRLDPAYKMALTGVESPRLAAAIVATPRLKGRMLQRFAQVFELPERPDMPPSMVELLQDKPELWSELIKSAGLMLHFKRLPPVLIKAEMEAMANMFGKRIVGTVFANRNFAPHWDASTRLQVENLDFTELYEDGARSLRLWAKERLGDMIGWFMPLLPPAVGEDVETLATAPASFDDALSAMADEAAHAHALRLTPDEIQQRIAMIDLLLPLIRTVVREENYEPVVFAMQVHNSHTDDEYDDDEEHAA